MGSLLEFNDTLQLTAEQGFPEELVLDAHLKKQFQAKAYAKREFGFEKPGLRVFHPAPTRVFLVHNIGGRWLYWGHAHVVEQTLDARKKTTRGRFVITKFYTPEQMTLMSFHDVPKGKEFVVR